MLDVFVSHDTVTLTLSRLRERGYASLRVGGEGAGDAEAGGGLLA